MVLWRLEAAGGGGGGGGGGRQQEKQKPHIAIWGTNSYHSSYTTLPYNGQLLQQLQPHYSTLHYTKLHCTNYATATVHYTTPHYTTRTTLQYSTRHYTSYATLRLQRQLQLQLHYTNYIILQPQLHYTGLQLQLCYTTHHATSSSCG